MVKVIRMYLDQTFEEKTVKTSEDKLHVARDYTPNFKIGKSVFKERPKSFLIRLLTFWKRPRSLVLLVDGSKEAVSLETDEFTKPALAFNFGTMKDTKDFVARIIAKSKANQKPMNNFQFMILAVLVGLVVVFQIMIMKGVTF